ncbi:MAG: glycosyltransferase family 2 protein [Rhodospirillales bacterium]|nr:glycosyltransferase family 2 protein [Rhodospirillales bacterium]
MSLSASPRLGIAITTYNRREVILAQIAAIRAMTISPFVLVVCDDGSTDGTIEALGAAGETVLGGDNRGIAWNKNRGIFYLLNIARCDVVLLIDDDVLPRQQGWEVAWVEAAWRHGHVNLSHPHHPAAIVGGKGTPEDPGLTTIIAGWAFAFSRHALTQIGYLDLRFGRYGHEHSDFSYRAIRAGFGGIRLGTPEHGQVLFFSVEGGLDSVPTLSSGTQEELAANWRLLLEIGREPVYRQAWRDDEEMASFMAEMVRAAPPAEAARLRQANQYPALEDYQLANGLWAAPETWLFVLNATIEAVRDALAEAARVIVVEPEAPVYYALTERFAAPIAEGRLVLENFAPAPRGGEIALLTPGDGGRPYHVVTISWEELVAKHGHPARVHMSAEIPGFPVISS